jgi:hypothetical protein
MLDRPQFLLNPWAVRSTETGEQTAQGGDMFRRKGEPPPSEGIPAVKSPAPGDTPPGAGGDFANLDFLADPAAVLLNLVPDEGGVVRVDRKKLGPHALVTVVAVDPLTTTVRTTSLAERPARFVDLRMRDGLDPAGHFTQQKQVSVLAPGKPFVVADVNSSRFEAYDSLARVYALYATLSKDPKLAEFAFVLNWPKLTDAEKRERYSRHACHELHFFLWRKDPAFFNTVVKPYLANKKDRTFLDHWLLGDDVSGFTDPWKHGRLNAVERVLLARRVPGEQPRTARHLDDLFRLLPPNVNRDRLLFDTAVQTSDLDTDGSVALAFGVAKKDAKGKATFANQSAAGSAVTGLGAVPGGEGPTGNMPGPSGRGGAVAPGTAPPAPMVPAPDAAKPQAQAEEKQRAMESLELRRESEARDGRSRGRGGKDAPARLGDAEGDGKMLAEEQFF